MTKCIVIVQYYVPRTHPFGNVLGRKKRILAANANASFSQNPPLNQANYIYHHSVQNKTKGLAMSWSLLNICGSDNNLSLNSKSEAHIN
jgi:hypothetical protein